MATRRWLGTAAAVTQEVRLTPANVEIGDIFTATVNTKEVSFTATAATVANVTAGFTTAWNNSTIPEFSEVTATDQTTYVKLLADTAGKPFTVTSAATNGGAAATETFTAATQTAATGPNHWDDADNWSGNTVPVAADDVVFDQGSIDVKYGLSQSAITLTSLTRTMRYTGKIGLPEVNADSTSTYYEYRATYLAISATTVTLSNTAGTGSGRFKLDTGSVQTTLIVQNTGTRTETEVPSFVWKGTHASSALHLQKGDVGIAVYGSETATLLTINVGFVSSPQNDSDLYLGSGVTLTNVTLVQSGGEVEINSATTGTATIVQYDGTLVIVSGGHVSLAVRGGTCYYSSTGTLGGNTIVSGKGSLSFDRDLRAKTVTNPIEIHGQEAKLSDRNKVVGSLIVDVNEGGNSANIELGQNVRITRGTPA